MTTRSASAAASSTAPRSSSAEVMCCTCMLAGSGRWTGPVMSVTCAPRSRAAWATAKPILPLLGLLINRTGSRYSRVGPAETTTFRPRRSWGTGYSSAHAAAAISGGSAMRPRPSPSPLEPKRPYSGPRKCCPQLLSRATLFWTAGCSHIRSFMAGTHSTGHLTLSSVALARSLARPRAARLSRSALAPTHTTTSARASSR